MKKEYSLLVLMPEIAWGGAERQFCYLINNIPLKKIIVLCPHSYTKQNNQKVKVNLDNKNIEVIESEYSINGKTNEIKYYMQEIRRLLKTNNISTAIVYEAYGCYLIPYLKWKGIKVIYSERNSGEGIIESRLLKRFVGKSDVITTNSVNAQKILQQKYNRDIILVKNGIETESIEFKKNVKDVSKILVPARLSKIKNQMVVLEFLKKCVNYNGSVIFAGKIEDTEYMNELNKYEISNKLTKTVNFIGFTSDMESLYQKIDMVVLPSFVEGMSNIILECFVRKIPILVSNIEMNTFTDNLKTWSFNPKSSNDLAELFCRWTNLNIKEKEQVLEENREYVLKEHSLKNMAKEYYKIIERIS